MIPEKLKPNDMEAETEIFFQEYDIEENICRVNQKVKDREIIDKEGGFDDEINN